ncbi:YraN family protein [Candidatus Peregrinibacteria bacterium RIFOXYB2_FULL_32_7]|nr:MAG: YraN family protein [Candidatus Peregrinibacteria bacterium RIFOXYB2_FULL_32_7]
MLKSKKNFGNFGEKIAAQYLRAKGYEILDHNFYIQGGEIDLICNDQEKNEIVFVEVKTRRNNTFGDPIDSISEWKIQKLTLAGEIYLQKHGFEEDNYRFDFIGIEFNNENFDIEHVKNMLL